MKRSSRRRSKPDPVRIWIQQSLDERQGEWHIGLTEWPTTDWEHLLGLHLQMVELEKLLEGLDLEMA